MSNLDRAFAAWSGQIEAVRGVAPECPAAGIAVEGDFSGIQRFVLRPVPGAGGAARRLRARSFRVLALTRLVAAEVQKRFAPLRAALFYSAGGRFLMVAPACGDWRDRIGALQRDLDKFLLGAYRGELAFHLAGAEFKDGKIPAAELRDAMNRRKLTPLEGKLRSADGWATDAFIARGVNDGKCGGCGASAELQVEEEEQLCQTCIDDRELGKTLLGGGATGLTRAPRGPIELLEARWAPAAKGEIAIPFIAHAPLSDGRLATFEDLSERAAGKEYLAYLHIDADRIGQAFRDLAGDPYRIWGLSRLLDETFSSGIERLLGSSFRNLYPVYGGGDDLFLIGPWNDVLDFAVAFRAEFRALTDNRLSFSAGVALAKPRQHILTKSEEAAEALDVEAKSQRDSIHALGETIAWDKFDKVYDGAKRLASLHAEGKMRSAFLHDLVDLHDRSRRRDEVWPEGDPRWHSRLYYQIERNLSGEAKSFAQQAFLSLGELWEHARFIARYAMLYAGGTRASREARN